MVMPLPGGAASPWSMYSTGAMISCRSGAGRPSLVRTNAMASPTFEVSMPLRRVKNLTSSAGFSASSRVAWLPTVKMHGRAR